MKKDRKKVIAKRRAMYSRVYVEITNICNKNCSFCHGHNRPLRRMSREEFSHVLDELKGKTSYVYYHLMGEPLTHSDLPTMIRMAGERGFRSVITTNGTLLGQRGEELIQAGTHKISVSLHSFEEGEETSLEDYLGQVMDFADMASSNGVIVVLRLWNRGFDAGRNETILHCLRERLQGEWAENTKGIRIRKKLHLEWGDRFEWPDRDQPDGGEQVFCYGLGDHFGILSDGRVVPCCLDSEGVINLGNVFEESLSDILESDRAIRIREGFQNRYAAEALCRRCPYARRFSE